MDLMLGKNEGLENQGLENQGLENQGLKNNEEKKDGYLEERRIKINGLDNQLLEILGKRFEETEKVGIYKKENNIPIFQKDRHRELIDSRKKQASMYKIGEEFSENLFELIHSESLDQQIKIAA